MRANDYISMKTIQGDAKMCCLGSSQFREQVIALAKANGLNLQDFLLIALRDKVYGDSRARRTVEGRRRIALESLFRSKRASQEVRDIVEQALKKYMPKP